MTCLRKVYILHNKLFSHIHLNVYLTSQYYVALYYFAFLESNINATKDFHFHYLVKKH